MKRILAVATGLALSAMTVAPVALADETNPDIVHRQAIFKLLGGHMTALKSILFLKHGAKADVVYHAEGLASALARLGDAFPAGSDKGDTKAKPEIWRNMDDFKKKGKDLGTAVDALVAAAKGGDASATVAAFKDVGGACKACHDDYREK